jgi:probable F420-dependent oxidoreductase
MEIGLALPQYGPAGAPAEVVKFARTAEFLGFDSLWVGDRLLTPVKPSDPYPAAPQPYPSEFTSAADPLIVWTAAAAATTRIRLGSSTLNAPWYNGPLLARSLTTIDVLSNGRLDVGLGTSWMRDEYTAANVDWPTRAWRLDETLDLLQAWWTQNPVEFHGHFFEVPESVVDLRPVQAGGPPILLGGFTERALQRVGRRANGYLALDGLPDDYQTHLWDVACRAAEEAGRDPQALRRVMRMNPTDKDLDAWVGKLATMEEKGYDATFVDLTFCTGSVDESLDVAEALMKRLANR